MRPPAVNLRDAVEADLPAIVEIYNSTIPGRMATASTEPVSIESRVHWFHAHNPKTRPLWVAETDTGEIAGWLSLNTFLNGRPAYDATVEVSIYISDKHRRTGLGRRMLEEAITRAPACGITTLVGFIWAHNTPSLRLAETLGFEHWGRMPRVAVMDGIDRDLVVMGKRLTP